MSIIRKSSSDPVFSQVSREALIEFAKTMVTELAAINLTPEQAVDSGKIRPMLVEFYWKVQKDEASAKLAQAEDAGVNLFKGKLGITPEVEQRQSVKDWVMEFGKDTADEMPKVRIDQAGNYICGLPEAVPCCDKKHVVGTWAVLEGSVYGLCDNAAGGYNSVQKELGRKPRLKYTDNLETARQIAQAQAQDQPITMWVYSLAWNKTTEMPAERKDAEGKYLCGLPESVPCCDKKQAGSRYAAYSAVVYGLCEKAARIYWRCYNETESRAVQSTDNLEMAEKIAASQAKDKPLFDWVIQFVTLAATEYPAKRINEAGQYVCGIPDVAGCCDHTQPTERFPSWNGEAYGICKRANWAFRSVADRLGDPPCLKSAGTLEKAEEIAGYQRGNNGEQSNTPRSPLGNKTEPDSRHRSEQRKSRKSAESKERYEKKPKPNQGSGDIAAQSMGRGNSKK